jgi:hypothetical protein
MNIWLLIFITIKFTSISEITVTSYKHSTISRSIEECVKLKKSIESHIRQVNVYALCLEVN